MRHLEIVSSGDAEGTQTVVSLCCGVVGKIITIEEDGEPGLYFQPLNTSHAHCVDCMEYILDYMKAHQAPVV